MTKRKRKRKEVIISSRKFSDSMYKDSKEKDAVMKFIRSNTTPRGRKITISTRLRPDNPYEVTREQYAEILKLMND